MIKAIIFDCFGVLTSDGWLPFASKHFGSDPIKKQEAHDLNKQVDAGLLDYKTFVSSVAELAKVSLIEAHRDIENNVPNQDLFAYIATLVPTYKIGLLSNAGANWLNELFTPKQLSLFSAYALSFEMGVIKPHPKAYHTICQKLGVEPHEAVFIDDIERYVTGAKDIGMHGIWFKDTKQAVADLQKLLLANSN